MYDAAAITLRPNVSEDVTPNARKWLAYYYAHCSALDSCVGEIRRALRERGIEDNTILVFTSDHGDMLGSQGYRNKQVPWDESIRVPFLLRYPSLANWCPRESDALIDAPDIMPTLLGLAGIEVPESVEGLDYSAHIRGGADPSDGAVLIMCPHPFGQWNRSVGGKEYRGLRTKRHTYTRSLDGSWLLYDNERDPYQLDNLVGRPDITELQAELDAHLQRKLDAVNDQFLPGTDYIRQWAYTIDEKTGTVPYTL